MRRTAVGIRENRRSKRALAGIVQVILGDTLRAPPSSLELQEPGILHLRPAEAEAMESPRAVPGQGFPDDQVVWPDVLVRHVRRPVLVDRFSA